MLRELRKKLDNKEIGAKELCRGYLDRIKQKDEKLNSFITVCEDYALKCAEEAQTAIDSGKSMPLSGIPVSIKDNICTKGIRTTCASKMLKDFGPPYDATAADRLLKNGAVLLGKTNMDEFAMGSEGVNSYFNAVKNPYNPELVAGGSSAGAAAAVSADLCAAALGSDTGGSVRLPAAFCGVVGLNPTYGRVSRYGLIAFASSLDRIGVISKTAGDAGYMLGVISGADEKDATCARRGDTDFLSLVGKSIAGMKIGIPKEFFAENVSDEIKNACMRAASFYESNGAVLTEVSIPSLEYAVSAYYIISSAEAASNLARYDGIKFGYCAENGTSFKDILSRSRTDGFAKEVKERIMLGNYVLSGGYYDKYYKKAMAAKSAIKREFDEIFEKCGFILTPTAPNLPQKAGRACRPSEVYKNDIYTVISSIAGLPAISVPCGFSESGMPIGMSLTGRAFDEKTIIAAADLFERERGGKDTL